MSHDQFSPYEDPTSPTFHDPPPGWGQAMPGAPAGELSPYRRAGAVLLVPSGDLTPSEPFVVLADYGRRFVARLIDLAIYFVLIELFIAVIERADNNRPLNVVIGVLLGVAAFGYEPVMTARFGGGFGKLAMGIRVARTSNGLRPPNVFQAAWRFLVLLLLMGLLDVLWPLWDRRKQSLHDKASATIVIRRPPVDNAAPR